jgi:hypothetical protein
VRACPRSAFEGAWALAMMLVLPMSSSVGARSIVVGK